MDLRIQPLDFTSELELQSFIEARSTPEAMRNGCGLPSFLRTSDPKTVRNTAVQGVFRAVVNDKSGPITAGYSCYYFSALHKTVSFDVVINPPWQKNGLSRQVHDKMVEFVFETLGARTINHQVMPENAPVRAILESYPYSYVGSLREYSRDIESDTNRLCLEYELTAEDYHILKYRPARSSAASYGIDDPAFLESECDRLQKQMAFSLGSVEDLIAKRFGPESEFSICDLGCGTGDALARMRSIYPNSKLTGVDTESVFLKIATSKHVGKEIEFKEADILADAFLETEQHDVYLLRAVAQHIGPPGLRKLFAEFSRFAKPGALFVVGDIDDRLWAFEPPCPGIEALLRAAKARQEKFGGDRNIGLKAPNLGEEAGLSVASFTIMPFDSRTLGHKLFFSISDVLFHTFPDKGYLRKEDREAMVRLYEEWKQDPRCLATGGYTTTVLEKKVSH